uniref:hypothetical protein n=1 Tax=Streptomyces flavovirens TaxID=52258 RepID=UPI0004C9768F|nr:hypothetical protein [Streptomyces flavovirens]
MDELRRRVYGAGHKDPHAYAGPGHDYVELVGGPQDGLPLDVTGLTHQERTADAILITNQGQFGPGGRADYEPRAGDTDRWDWAGDVP